MYETKNSPLLPWPKFRVRVLYHSVLAFGLVTFALLFGVVGYHFLGNLEWIDSLLEASMILGGMGPVQAPHTPAAKLFASFYALFAGLAFITIASVLVAPIAHRLLHSFHLEDSEQDSG